MRDSMTLDLHTLNPEQRRAVEKLSGPLMILAGAGTGKTRVITYRIANLILHGATPNKIAAMTFTNKAANEMRERLKQVVPKSASDKVFIGTFHKFCLTILRRWSEFIERPKNFTLINQSDQIYLVKQALEEVRLDALKKPEDVLYEISRCKNALLTPEDLSKEEAYEKLNFKDMESLQAAYANYERLLKVNKALDFDDLLLGGGLANLLALHYGLHNHRRVHIAGVHSLDHRLGGCVLGTLDLGLELTDLTGLLVEETHGDATGGGASGDTTGVLAESHWKVCTRRKV